MADNSIGALWINEGKNGKFMAGKITIEGVSTPIAIFKNKYKNTDNHPDYRIFVSKKQVEKIPDIPSDDLEPF